VRVALVGYTNVGKSSLLNALCNADVLVQNKLFATLDTATRRLYLPQVGNVTLTDTVGFLRKLPHHLVASFRSTLDVVLETDLLLIVIDATSPWVEAQLETVTSVLSELGAAGQRRLLVFNKADLLSDTFARKKLEVAYPGTLFVSARTGEGIGALKEQITAALIEATQGPAMEALLAERAEPEEDELPGPPK
jgi:GTP-binding protein HflX